MCNHKENQAFLLALDREGCSVLAGGGGGIEIVMSSRGFSCWQEKHKEGSELTVMTLGNFCL